MKPIERILELFSKRDNSSFAIGGALATTTMVVGYGLYYLGFSRAKPKLLASSADEPPRKVSFSIPLEKTPSMNLVLQIPSIDAQEQELPSVSSVGSTFSVQSSSFLRKVHTQLEALENAFGIKRYSDQLVAYTDKQGKICFMLKQDDAPSLIPDVNKAVNIVVTYNIRSVPSGKLPATSGSSFIESEKSINLLKLLLNCLARDLEEQQESETLSKYKLSPTKEPTVVIVQHPLELQKLDKSIKKLVHAVDQQEKYLKLLGTIPGKNAAVLLISSNGLDQELDILPESLQRHYENSGIEQLLPRLLEYDAGTQLPKISPSQELGASGMLLKDVPCAGEELKTGEMFIE